jgi:ATP-dependent RNA helicase DeaD
VEFATYRLAVGRQNNVTPGAIVGAIANEGGLSRGDFGHISIRNDHSLVELPRDLDRETLTRLRGTRISGVPIGIKKDEGGSPRQRSAAPRGGNGKTFGRERRGSQKVAGRARP